jgi:transcriptional regulator with XRE-family HTH domain
MADAVVRDTRAPTILEVLRGNLIFRRARARLSQEELAERAGVSRPTISRIERAACDVGVETVERIAIALGVPVADLFVPARRGRVDDDELERRLADPESEFVDAFDLLDAIDEAAEPERYSRAGRPPMVR